ncbi:MAG: gliding motility-associated C-terminal domain-containing protein [Saprospiraceae bacterium]|nr:gliding motility-associated C-terminal domain-containing protein [Saprospiraceae bacterium]
MPNAFSPGGKNSIFRPVFSFIENITTYEMLIVDRGGQILFRSANPRTGWDGTKNGENLPQGAYVYLVRVGVAGNRQIEKKERFCCFVEKKGLLRIGVRAITFCKSFLGIKN